MLDALNTVIQKNICHLYRHRLLAYCTSVNQISLGPYNNLSDKMHDIMPMMKSDIQTHSTTTTGSCLQYFGRYKVSGTVSHSMSY